MIWILILVIDLIIIENMILLCYLSLRRKPHDIRAKTFAPGSPKEAIQKAILESQDFFQNHPYEPMVLEANGVELYGRRFIQTQPVGRILLFHGYRSAAEIDFGPVVSFYDQLGYELVLVDQRAHGKSSGSWIGLGILERFDCLSWIRFLNETYGELPTFLNGVSMGCTTVLMALGLPLPQNVKGVIADCGFTSPKEMIATVFCRKTHLPAFPIIPVLSLFSKLFCGYYFGEYSVPQALKSNRIPILFIHGTEDRFVPPEMTERNYEACAAEKELLLVEGAAHATAYLQDKPSVEKAIQTFLKKCLVSL